MLLLRIVQLTAVTEVRSGGNVCDAVTKFFAFI